MPRPFRFGAVLHKPLPGLSWAASARQIERLGYSTLQMPDHLTEQHAVAPALAVAAAATTTLRVGSLVFGNDYRHPLMLAKDMATLDVISGGRLEFGLGAGWMRTDYDASGMPYDRPGLRIERMVEALEVIYGAFGPGPFSYSGRHYTISDYDGQPKPLQPRVPLVIGGGGKKMLGIAARHADIVGVSPNLRSGAVDDETIMDAVADSFDQKLRWVRDAAGDRFDQIDLNVLIQSTHITSSSQETEQSWNLHAEFLGTSVNLLRDTPMLLIGTFEEVADIVRRRRERWGFNYVSVQDDTALKFADVIPLLDGE